MYNTSCPEIQDACVQVVWPQSCSRGNRGTWKRALGVMIRFMHTDLSSIPSVIGNLDTFGVVDNRGTTSSGLRSPAIRTPDQDMHPSDVLETRGGSARSCITTGNSRQPGVNSSSLTYLSPFSSLLSRGRAFKGKSPLFQLPASRIFGRPQVPSSNAQSEFQKINDRMAHMSQVRDPATPSPMSDLLEKK
ncbi:hypothetical protein ACET3Z_013682 [Daucus carota]